jgi:hypothetical protein
LSAGVLHSSRSKKFGKGLVGSVETSRPIGPKWPSWNEGNDCQAEWLQVGTMTAGRCKSVVDRHATTADACLTLFPIEKIVSSTCRIDRNTETDWTKMAELERRK